MMRKLALALALLSALSLWGASPLAVRAQVVGTPNAITCNKIAQLAVGTSTITQIVAAPSGLSAISICGFHVSNTGSTGTFSFQYGTGSNCGASPTTLWPATNVTSTAPSIDHIDYASIGVPSANALCVTPSVNTISVVVYYAVT
jgi:hypothetical protein